MKSLKPSTAGWIGGLLLFGGCAFSMVSLFQGNLYYLAISIALLIAGLYFLKISLSA